MRAPLRARIPGECFRRYRAARLLDAHRCGVTEWFRARARRDFPPVRDRLGHLANIAASAGRFEPSRNLRRRETILLHRARAPIRAGCRTLKPQTGGWSECQAIRVYKAAAERALSRGTAQTPPVLRNSAASRRSEPRIGPVPLVPPP